MTEIKDIINYETDSLEDICAYEINRMYMILDNLKKENRLCSHIGQEVIAEFEFTGDKYDVEFQLALLINQYELEGIKEEDRKYLLEKDLRVKQHRDDRMSDVYRNKIMESINTNEMPDALRYSNIINLRKEVLHEKKECLCYSNRIIKND